MGTNFYMKVAIETPHNCELHHIGKRSYGWCFSLHANAKYNLMDLGSWTAFLMSDKVVRIFDEYEKDYTWTEMTQIIIDDKTWAGKEPQRHTRENVLLNGEEHYDVITGHFR